MCRKCWRLCNEIRIVCCQRHCVVSSLTKTRTMLNVQIYGFLFKIFWILDLFSVVCGIWPFTSGVSSQTPIVSDLAALELLSGTPRFSSSSILGSSNSIFGPSSDVEGTTRNLESISKNAAIRTNQENMLMNNLANLAALRRNQILREGVINGSSADILRQLNPSSTTLGLSSTALGPLASALGIPSTGIGTSLGAQIPLLDSGSLAGRHFDPSFELASLLRSNGAFQSTQILPLSEFSPISNNGIIPGQIPPGLPTALQQINEERLRNQFRILGADPRIGSITPPSRPLTRNFGGLSNFEMSQFSPFKNLRRSGFMDDQIQMTNLRNPFENSSGLLRQLNLRGEGFNEEINDAFGRAIPMKDSVLESGLEERKMTPEKENETSPEKS